MDQQVRERAGSLNVTRLSEPAGAEVVGIDLSLPLGTKKRDILFEALLKHHVLVIRDQDLTPDQQMALTAMFGKPESHVFHDAEGKSGPQVHVVNNLDKQGNPSSRPTTFGSFFWHTDKSYHEVPSLATFLHARELPPGGGGDTEFANMYNAYESLDDAVKKQIANLRAVHSWEANRRNTGNRPATEEEKKLRPPVSHPLVRTHPDTKRKALYIGIHADCIEGLEREQGIELLKKLYRH